MTAEVHHLPIQELYSEDEPLIPAGIYSFKLLNWETRVMFAGKASKVVLKFVVSDGEYAGAVLKAYYNVKRIKNKPKKKGGFIVGKKSNFAREFFTLMEKAGVSTSGMRLDRLPVSYLEQVEGKVRTVKEASKKPIPKALQYSVIAELTDIYGLP